MDDLFRGEIFICARRRGQEVENSESNSGGQTREVGVKINTDERRWAWSYVILYTSLLAVIDSQFS